ncbi:SDR family oxidoreductase [Arthrobacter agilis]|uniref:SDR family oxidoreductase n=1 Tax=Arthrobacter agilis TaxID=37921 RepID=UPI00278967AB|nr:SDR family oxidoreductase [Arthrobacter agilis]MDQ0734446.1 short-subunit dehydrogenase [Arthrobacter agilis]
MRIRNSVVVITGAASGIGRATALRFARRGTCLVLASRRAEALETLAAECTALGSRAIAVPTDMSDHDAVQELASRAVEEFGRIDVWVNDAAVAFFSPFLEVPLRDFQRVIDVNVMGYVYGARAALERMQEQGSGVLVNVASIVGEVPQPYSSAYSVSKAAVRALGVSLRSELTLDRKKRIHVCTVLPPTIDTPFFHHAANYTGRRVVAMPPVYSADRVAKTILGVVEKPVREIAVGRIGRSMVRQHRLMPGQVEKGMAHQVEHGQLSRTEPAEDSTGNLYGPSLDPANAAVTGGWSGRRRTAQRVVLGTALVGVGAVVFGDKLKAAAPAVVAAAASAGRAIRSS